MATGDLNIAMILKFVDQLTGPAKPALATMKKFGIASEAAGRKGVDWSNQQLAANNARRSALRGEILETAGLGFALFQALKPAVQFESAMASVSKVIDFDRSDGLKLLGDDILALTTDGRLPMAAEGIAEIIEAAGQAGVVDSALPDDEERRQLIEFATAAAKMGVAFDISAEASGEAMAQWRKSLKLSQKDALLLGDAVNHLSNNMNAKAPAIVDIIRRQGAVAMTAGLAETEVAALAAAILSGGASQEVAATGLKNFTNALVKGEAMTKKQRAVMQSLGIDAEELAERMQVDAKGGIIAVVEALAELPKHKQNAAIGQLFGEEAKGAITPLLTNIALLKEAFGLVSDEVKFAGAMQKEYEKQSATTANALIVTKSFLTALAVTAGSIVLPELNNLLATIQPIIKAMSDWAAANPELIGILARAVVGLLAFKMGSLALRWALFSALTPILQMIKFVSYIPVVMGAGIRGIGLLGRVLAWVAKGPIKMLLLGIRAIGLAAMANPISLVVAAVLALAYVIYDNWGAIVEWFKTKIEDVRAAFDQGLLRGVLKLLAEFNPFTLMHEGITALVDYILTSFVSIDLVQTGKDMIQGLWDGAGSLVITMVSAIKAKLSGIMPDWMKSAWNWVANGSDQGASQPKRDSGGPVRAGQPYWVGERAAELFVPGVSGSILSSRSVKAAMAASAMATTAIAAPSQAEIARTVDQRPAISASAFAPQSSKKIDIGQIVIHAAPGMDVEEVAMEVKRQLEALMDTSADLHDGGSF